MGALKNTLNRLSLENRDLKQECGALKAAAVAAAPHVPMASLDASCDRFSRHIAVERIRSLAKVDVEVINGDVAAAVGWSIASPSVATFILWLSEAPDMSYIIPLSSLGLACQCRSAAMANLRWLDKDGGSYGWARNENGAGW